MKLEISSNHDCIHETQSSVVYIVIRNNKSKFTNSGITL
jgi:hypothetical protein